MTNANNQHETTDATLRQIFEAMDPHQAQEIRDAYYNVVCGLRTLIDTLEHEDAKKSETGPLLDEHFIACVALEAMNKSRLGKIL